MTTVDQQAGGLQAAAQQTRAYTTQYTDIGNAIEVLRHQLRSEYQSLEGAPKADAALLALLEDVSLQIKEMDRFASAMETSAAANTSADRLG